LFTTLSEITHQFVGSHIQSLGNFHQRIQGGRFFATLNAADENSRKTSIFSQLFLAETCFLSSGPNCFAQETAVLAGRHDFPEDRKQSKPAMSLTTSLSSCNNFAVLVKTGIWLWGVPLKSPFEKVKNENIQKDHFLTIWKSVTATVFASQGELI